MKIMSFKFQEDNLYDRFKKQCKIESRTQSNLLRIMIKDYLDKVKSF